MADMSLTLLVFGMLLLFMGLLSVIAYFIYSYVNRNRLHIRIEVPVSQNFTEVWLQRLVIIGAIAAVLVGLSLYTGRASFCANCHTQKKEAKALAKSSHKGIDCLSCHQSAGISGAMLQKVDYTRWLWIYAVTNTVKPKRASIDDGACLRCHNEIRYKTVSRYSVKVRHKDFLDKGARCVDCHNTIAHAEVVKPERSPTMDPCLKCHNDKIAKADCATCHEKDVGAEMRRPKRGVMKVGIFVGWDFCYRCHDGKNCTKCHGVQMPHPPEWLRDTKEGFEAKHALPAFTKREVCWRCHDLPSAPLQPAMMQACGCHGTMGYHGPQEKWRKEHGGIATGRLPGDGENNFCYNCHSQLLCDHCHPKGKYRALQQPGGAAAVEH